MKPHNQIVIAVNCVINQLDRQFGLMHYLNVRNSIW
jgi:hypothetical protein